MKKKRTIRRHSRKKNRAVLKAIGRGAKKVARGWWNMQKATHAPKRKAAEAASKKRGRRATDRGTKVPAEVRREYTDAEVRQMIKDRHPLVTARPHRKNPSTAEQAAAWIRGMQIWRGTSEEWAKRGNAAAAKRHALIARRFARKARALGASVDMPAVPKATKNPKKHSAPLRLRGKKKNGAGELLGAAKMYEKFHGKPADKVTTRHEREIARKDYAKLGDLVKLEVNGEHCLVFEEGAGTIVACEPQGKQLYIIGGTQNVDGSLGTLGVDKTKDLIDLGDCTQIEYFTRKAFDQFKPVVYYHEFGEESGVKPRLMYNRLNKKLYLVGGEYRVEKEGIMN